MQPALKCLTAATMLVICGLGTDVSSDEDAAPKTASDGPSAAKIIQRMANAYKDCKTYTDTGLVKTTYLRKDRQWVDEKPFTTAFVRPDQFRFEYTSKFPIPWTAPLRHIIWANGKDVRTWWDVRPGVKKSDSLGMAVAAATGVSSSAAHTIPRLLMPTEVTGWCLTELRHLKRIADASSDGEACYRIQGNYGDKDDEPLTLWISKKTFLIHRIDQTTKFPDFRTDATTTYKPQTGLAIEENKLEFGAPDKSDEIEILPARETYKAKPLPAGGKAFTWKTYKSAEEKWLDSTLVKNYEEFGEHSPRWDEQARAFLKHYARAKSRETTEPNPWPELNKLGEQLVALGCSDPNILYWQASMVHRVEGPAKAEPLVNKAFELLQKSRYPRIYAYYAARRLLDIRNSTHSNPEQNDELVKKKMTCLGQAAADKDYVGGNQRYYMEEFLFECPGCRMAPEGETLVRQVEQTPHVEPWIKLMVSGVYHASKGWKARGGGWAYKVTEEGGKKFMEELALATEDFTNAYELHPEFPEAASCMIAIAMAKGDSSCRLWFDRAVSAHFDYEYAYSNLLWTMTPRWGGSHEQMYEFGVECLNTKRFDTEIPRQFLNALCQIGSEMDDWRVPFKRPGAYEHLQTLFAGILEKSRTENRDYWKSIYAVTAWAAGKYGDAKKLFDELGKNLSAEVIDKWNFGTEFAIGETHLRVAASAVQFDTAETLFQEGQSVDALPLFEALEKSVKDDPPAQQFLQDRIAVLRWKKGFQEGGWVDLMPNKQLAGWENRGGDWVVNSDSRLIATTRENDAEAMLLCKFRVDDDYEIRGDIDAPYNACIVLGYGRRVVPVYMTFMIDPYLKKVFLHEGLYSNKNDLARTIDDHGTKNHVLLRVSKGRLTVNVNDKPIFVEQQIDPEWWSPSRSLIGVAGAYYNLRGYTMTFRNLQIRRLKEKKEQTDPINAKPPAPPTSK